MAKSIRDSKKSKLGRPVTTGPGKAQIVRMHAPQLKAIDRWIKAQDLEISRPEAIRRLVGIGLSSDRLAPQPTQKVPVHATQHAEAGVDRRTKDAPDAEVRKRKVLKGPSAFRDLRKD